MSTKPQPNGKNQVYSGLKRPEGCTVYQYCMPGYPCPGHQMKK